MRPAKLGYKKRIQPDRRARVQCQSVKKQYGGDLRRQKCKQWTDYRRCRKGRLWRIPTAGQGKLGCTGCLLGGHGKKEYEAMRRRVIWSFVFTIPLFYISMGHMLGWPLPSVFLWTENSIVYALTLFLPLLSLRNLPYRRFP